MEPEARLFLCGDVMTGRGVDQALPHPVDPVLRERYVRDAREYIKLAERAHGSWERPMEFGDIWGDAHQEWKQFDPALRLINLETSVTNHDIFEPDKGIHYRMSPNNLPALTSAGIDVCNLANNHVLDFGTKGLRDTLRHLREADIKSAGAGVNSENARDPAVVELEQGGRLIILGYGLPSSGIPADWQAAPERPGVNVLSGQTETAVDRIRDQLQEEKYATDFAIVSIHWGGNWGFEIPETQRRLAHQLIEQAHVDLIHGHSSHHVKGIEVHRGKLILYGCGDFLTDYEGISGHETYRDDLGLMYFPRVNLRTGRLQELAMTPTKLRQFRIHRASRENARWLKNVLNEQGETLGTRVDWTEPYRLRLGWDES